LYLRIEIHLLNFLRNWRHASPFDQRPGSYSAVHFSWSARSLASNPSTDCETTASCARKENKDQGNWRGRARGLIDHVIIGRWMASSPQKEIMHFLTDKQRASGPQMCLLAGRSPAVRENSSLHSYITLIKTRLFIWPRSLIYMCSAVSAAAPATLLLFCAHPFFAHLCTYTDFASKLTRELSRT
jgi:hypothetical protein